MTADPPGRGREDPAPDPVPPPDHDDDWRWRRKVRSNPHSHRLYRGVVAIVGLVIVVGGLLLVPAPGPGWLIVFLGVAVWASEFDWARRLLHWGRQRLSAWNAWMRVQSWWLKALVTLGTLAIVAAVVYGYLRWQGPPPLLPDSWEQWLRGLLGP